MSVRKSYATIEGRVFGFEGERMGNEEHNTGDSIERARAVDERESL